MTSRIDTLKFYEYCRIPVDELENHPDSKITFKLKQTALEVDRCAANMMADEVIENNKTDRITRWVLPVGFHDQVHLFVDRVNRERISLKNVFIITMDDYLDWNCRPYPEGHQFNTSARFERVFYDKIDPELTVPANQRFRPLYNNLDLVDNLVDSWGGLDTVYGGLGFRGLVAFCEAPYSPWFTITEDEYCQMKTRIYPLNDDTTIAYAVRNLGGLTHMRPPLAISIGMKSMLKTKRLVLTSTTGEWKRAAVRALMFLDPTVEYPATLFPNKVDEVILVCDRNTAEAPIQPDNLNS